MHGAQVIESFHLAFLEVLRHRLDPSRYVLKGGANLRYFFSSVRLSEDIDLDISGVEGWMLREKIDSVLDSQALAINLRSNGLTVLTDEVSRPKQSDTPRRWKVPLTADGHARPIRTKIEFSNRNGEQRHKLEAVASHVVAPYGLTAPLVRHYLHEPATEQKVRALAGRSETQARDVFDLDLLLRRGSLVAGAVEPEIRQAAADRGVELPYEAFADQVLPFLEPAVASTYDRAAWERMQLFVTEALLEDRS